MDQQVSAYAHRPRLGAVSGIAAACAALLAAFSACSNPLMEAAESLKADAVSPKLVVSHSGSKPMAAGGVLDYGSITIGSSMNVELSIANEGKSALDIDLTNLGLTSGAATEADTFAIGTKPSGRIAAGASSTMIVTFTPSADGDKTATISIPTNDTKNPLFSFTVHGTGSSIAIATSAVSDIETTSATSGGNIAEAGGQSISTRGICWDTLPNPTIDDSIVEIGSGSGDFNGVMTDLSAGTLYYVRAYASSATGCTYGPQRSFMTLPEAPMAPSVSALGNPAGSGKLAVSWSAVTGASIYDLYCSSSNSFPSAQSPISTASTTYTVGGLTNFSSYYFWIKARNASGPSAASPTMASPVMVGVKVSSITLSKSSATFLEGSSETITATCYPSTATVSSVTWTTSNASVAAVSGGVITGGAAAGSATITVTADDGQGASATFAATTKAYLQNDVGPAGGILFYDKLSYSNGWRYMEAAPVNVGGGHAWSPYAYYVNIAGAYGTGIGTGLENSLAIETTFGNGTYLARDCLEYSLNGYTDWFMPSYSLFAYFVSSTQSGNGQGSHCRALDCSTVQWGDITVVKKSASIVTRPVRRF